MKRYYYESEEFYAECYRRAQSRKAFLARVAAAHAASAPAPVPVPSPAAPVVPFTRTEKRPLAA